MDPRPTVVMRAALLRSTVGMTVRLEGTQCPLEGPSLGVVAAQDTLPAPGP